MTTRPEDAQEVRPYVLEWTEKFPPEQPSMEFEGKCSPETWARFWSKVYRIAFDMGGSKDDCYWWKAGCDDEGYPIFWLNKEEYQSYTGLVRENGGTVRVLGWLLFQLTGKKVKEGNEVHHGCCTPECKARPFKGDPHHSCVRHLVEKTLPENHKLGKRAQPQQKVPWWVRKDEWMAQKTIEETMKDRDAVEKLKERHRKRFPQGPESLQGDNQYWQPEQPRPGFSVYNEEREEFVHVQTKVGDKVEGQCKIPSCQLPFIRIFCTDRKWRDIDTGSGNEHWKVCKGFAGRFMHPLFDVDYESKVVPGLELKDTPPLTRLDPLTNEEQLRLIDKQERKNVPKVDAEIVGVVKPGEGKNLKSRRGLMGILMLLFGLFALFVAIGIVVGILSVIEMILLSFWNWFTHIPLHW